MKYANPVKPDIWDVMATAVQLAAQELAAVYPQPQVEDSVKHWKCYLLQQAVRLQDQMTEEQRFAYRHNVLLEARSNDAQDEERDRTPNP